MLFVGALSLAGGVVPIADGHAEVVAPDAEVDLVNAAASTGIPLDQLEARAEVDEVLGEFMKDVLKRPGFGGA